MNCVWFDSVLNFVYVTVKHVWRKTSCRSDPVNGYTISVPTLGECNYSKICITLLWYLPWNSRTCKRIMYKSIQTRNDLCKFLRARTTLYISLIVGRCNCTGYTTISGLCDGTLLIIILVRTSKIDFSDRGWTGSGVGIQPDEGNLWFLFFPAIFWVSGHVGEFLRSIAFLYFCHSCTDRRDFVFKK